MTSRPEFERNVAAWLTATAGEGTPDYLDEIETRVAVARQRAWWSSPERWLPMDLTARATTFPRPAFGRALMVALLLVALLAAALLIVGSRQRVPPPFGPAKNGVIGTGANGDIMLADADGSDLRTIVSGANQDEGITFSRSGNQIVFNRVFSETDSLPMLANADGTHLEPITDHSFGFTWWFDWAPTDDRVAMASEVDGHGHNEFEIVDVADRTVHSITPAALHLDNLGALAWRPGDANELIFEADPAGADEAAMFAIHPDGSGLREIAPPRASSDSYHTFEVTPDGRYVIYWNIENDATDFGHARTHLLDLTTGVDRQVTYGPPGSEASDAHLSPDGTQVVSTRWLPGNRGILQVGPLDGSTPARTIGPAFGNDDKTTDTFSPDGATVVLSTEGNAPTFIDVATGKTTIAPSVFKVSTWQRQAP